MYDTDTQRILVGLGWIRCGFEDDSVRIRVRIGEASVDVWFGLVWSGLVWCGLVWVGLVGYCLVYIVLYDLVWYGLECFGVAWFGLAWSGPVGFGLVRMVWSGLLWHYLVCLSTYAVIGSGWPWSGVTCHGLL